MVGQVPSKAEAQAEYMPLCATEWRNKFLHGPGGRGKQLSRVLRAEGMEEDQITMGRHSWRGSAANK